METSRQHDQNGFITIERNPISRVGVFPYSGRSLPDADPARVYNVLRPAEELSHPETLKSFALVPLIDEHQMLGDGFGAPAEEKGVHGTTGNDIVFEDGVLYAPLRIFSETFKRLMAAGKRQLSMGYRCVYEKTSGVFNGQAYDYIQRNIRGNHIALVQEGRMGKDIAVLDGMAFDHFDIEKQGEDMADEPDKTEEKKGMTIDEAKALLEELLPKVKELTALIATAEEVKTDPEGAAPALDAEEEAKKKAAEDEAAEKEKKEKEGMDSAITRIEALEKRTAPDTKTIMAEIKNRDALAKQVAEVVGTFDHSEMTEADVAKYALDKLEIKADAGMEKAVVTAFLKGKKSVPAGATFGMDAAPKKGSLLDKTLND